MTEKLRSYEEVTLAWEEVTRISCSRIIADSKEELLEFIEAPLKEAVGIFYDKNVQTIISSCNLTDYYQGFAWITLEGASLSSVNREIATSYKHALETYVDGTSIPIIGLTFPINPDHDLPEDIGRRAVELASRFEAQPPIIAI